MKLITLSVVAGGTVAAAFLAAGTANAETDPGTETPAASWAPVYQDGDAQLLQGPDSLIWSVPSEFTHGDTVLDGDTYITPSSGGFNTVFVTDDGDVYNQNQLFPGFTNLYYNPAGDETAAVDYLKTPFGTFNAPWMASSFAPADMSDLDPASPLETLKAAGLYSALNLGLGDDAPADVTWSPNYGDDPQLLADTDPYSHTWMLEDTTFTPSEGDAISGTNYVTQSLFGGIDDQFVTDDGAIYDQDQLGLGFTNLYYNPGEEGDIIDMLKTPFGTFDISWMAYAFTPTDFSDPVVATPDLTDIGLYSALDLGLEDLVS